MKPYNSNFNDTSNVAFYGDTKTIDARGYTGYALLSGKDNVDNVIYGNETSCAMWGGNGGNDTLIGGNGSDLFWYVNGGSLTVENARNSEVIFDFNDTKYAVNSSTGEWEFR